jgi:hypothetical protein
MDVQKVYLMPQIYIHSYTTVSFLGGEGSPNLWVALSFICVVHDLKQVCPLKGGILLLA